MLNFLCLSDFSLTLHAICILGQKEFSQLNIDIFMAKLDLTQYGITGSTVIAHNPSYEYLFEEETKAGLRVSTRA